MEYEERFGVKVDVRIPSETRTVLYHWWKEWKQGNIAWAISLQRTNLLTPYEHFAIGSGVNLPPDPFKPLALQHDGANLEAVVKARKRAFPPARTYWNQVYALTVPDFEKVTGLVDYALVAQYPETDKQGRIHIPKIVGVCDPKGKKVEFGDEVLAQLQLPRSNEVNFLKGVILREVFDFDNGYRIELVEK